MGLDAEEIAALGAEDIDGARVEAVAKFAALTDAYTVVTAQNAVAKQYTGDTFGVGINLDLSSVPKFVFTLPEEGAANYKGVTAVYVNGVLLEGENGEFVYEVENVHNLDNSFVLKTMSGETVVTEAKFELANYFAAASGSDVEALVEALYEYVLSAQAYGISKN